MSFNICSINILVEPYGLLAVPTGISSLYGIGFSGPYTVAEELNTNFLTLYFLIVSNNINAPETLFI